MNISKDKYLQSFGIIVVILALYRCAFPEVANETSGDKDDLASADSATSAIVDTIYTSHIVGEAYDVTYCNTEDTKECDKCLDEAANVPVRNISKQAKHPIYSVPSFKNTFPDDQETHLLGVKRWGIVAVNDRVEAERSKQKLVYVGANPYFAIDNLKTSVPYLVPQAAVLLNDIGRAYFDSLYVKDIPLHKIIVTSVLRTKVDVKRLQQYNVNATDNSCHLYGTTFDICYNRYVTVSNPLQAKRRAVQNDTLKWVLSEVLRDMRERNRCYIKYEVKQGCFHITVK